VQAAGGRGRRMLCDFSDKIFVGRPDGRFGVVARNSYKLEDVLHRFLKDHREASPGKGLETAREVRFLPAGPDSGVPDGDEGRDLDHPFLDRDALPTFLDVSRSSETCIPRGHRQGLQVLIPLRFPPVFHNNRRCP
jgi:hypothetical protein